MDIVGVSGLMLSVAGFAVALWQLHRTRRAAEAAMEASRDAVQSLRHIRSVATIQDICGRSRDLLHLARARNLRSAATAAFELRDLVVRFRATEAGKRLSSEPAWKEIIENVESTHERFESAAMTNRIDVLERELLLHTISKLHAQFSSFAAIAADSGVVHANP
jgi:hypothetical protein